MSDVEKAKAVARMEACQDVLNALQELSRSLPGGRPNSRDRHVHVGIEQAKTVVMRTLAPPPRSDG